MMFYAKSAKPIHTRSFVSSVLFTTERYQSMTVKGLQIELKKRKLPSTGSKSALVHRLSANDTQVSTYSTEPVNKVSSGQGTNLNAGQPLTPADNTSSKLVDLGAFTLNIPQPTRNPSPKNIKIPVLASNWSATADTIDSNVKNDVPKLSTASGISNVSHNLYTLEEELGESVENKPSRIMSYLNHYRKYFPEIEPVQYQTITRPLSKDEKSGVIRAAAVVAGLFALSYVN
ncbi:hypothetical protein E3P81_01886 [Wallemia ichthyophaga]|nr:hypothetical protein E3P97_01885 [Wallemia ichthyophaga]TIB29415.1 hypothetical protein E3P85_03166 [Wallemia ichthyophaga]TIB51345.1 hypothetical protein E3P81_01886 [Wallemia ichthyophaga]TIB59161.1 hypothetical protein E3P79_01882 [Wallemia ichthyophaga]